MIFRLHRSYIDISALQRTTRLLYHEVGNANCRINLREVGRSVASSFLVIDRQSLMQTVLCALSLESVQLGTYRRDVSSLQIQFYSQFCGLWLEDLSCLIKDVSATVPGTMFLVKSRSVHGPIVYLYMRRHLVDCNVHYPLNCLVKIKVKRAHTI